MIRQILATLFAVLLTAWLLFSPSLLLAEKQNHADEHQTSSKHDDHKTKSEAERHDHEKKGHDDHEEAGHGDHEEKEHDDYEEAGHGGHEEKGHGGHEEKGHGGHEEKGHGGHEEKGHGGHEEEAATDVELTTEQIQQAGIQTLRLKKQAVSQQISALGEVKLNQYKTLKVSSSITTRVEKRHVYLGDHIKKGDLLVTLHTIASTDISANTLATADLAASSADLAANIAQAKGELAIATARWTRLRSLGQDAVSGRRYTEAKIAKQQAHAKLKAYGKSLSRVNALLKSGSKAVQKHFELRAEQEGMIIKDDFVLGQVVTAEDVLFEISDTRTLWVEAKIKPNDVRHIVKGAKARIQAGDQLLQGKVINIGRILNENTRTLSVRIEVNNPTGGIYPGQFVKTFIDSQTTQAALAVPAEAVLRSADGDWMLFVAVTANRFEPKEIEVIENLGDQLIIKGIDSGILIVSKGAFTLQSELAKSGFSVHNH